MTAGCFLGLAIWMFIFACCALFLMGWTTAGLVAAVLGAWLSGLVLVPKGARVQYRSLAHMTMRECADDGAPVGTFRRAEGLKTHATVGLGYGDHLVMACGSDSLGFWLRFAPDKFGDDASKVDCGRCLSVLSREEEG